MQVARTPWVATYIAGALTVLTLLALPGNPHRGMGPFEIFALPLSLLALGGRDWPDWQFLPLAAVLIFIWVWPWTFAACWLIRRLQTKGGNGI